MDGSKWISVDERLPDENNPGIWEPETGNLESGNVLAYDVEWGQIEAYYDYRDAPRGYLGPGWRTRTNDVLFAVTHWQPLPPPPEATP